MGGIKIWVGAIKRDDINDQIEKLVMRSVELGNEYNDTNDKLSKGMNDFEEITGTRNIGMWR